MKRSAKTRTPSKAEQPVPVDCRLTRAERRQQIKADLTKAAAKVVGQVGYQNAMVSKITEEANVSHGTFYNYFESRQDLFDKLLPALGDELIDHIRTRATGAPNAFEREKRSFMAFFEFLQSTPEFYRVLYEAELFAPKGYKQHVDQIAELYVRTLEREAAQGQITLINHQEAETIAFMLMGARHYLCMHFARENGRTVALPEDVLNAYLRIISTGMYHTSDGLTAEPPV